MKFTTLSIGIDTLQQLFSAQTLRPKKSREKRKVLSGAVYMWPAWRGRGGQKAANSFWNHDRVDQITIFPDGESQNAAEGKSVKIMLITRCEPRQ